MPAADPRLKHLQPGWFAIPMGLCGLSLAWHRAQPLMGDGATAAALALGLLAAAVFVLLAAAFVLRALRHPQAWADDRRHPVRHAFIAAIPVSAILLATVLVALAGPGTAALGLWALGALGQLAATAWVLGRWLRGSGPGGLPWAAVTPGLLIPIVGNVLVPLAGVPLGQGHWALAQLGVGALFWPVVLALLAVRLAQQGLWPDRLLPTSFILVAPPAVVGLALLQLGAPEALAWALWGIAAFTALWVGQLAQRIASLPFGLPHWGLSFPLAALSALTLRLAAPGSALAVAGVGLLALSSLVIAALALATLRGLRDGSLLVAEPVAVLQPVAAR